MAKLESAALIAVVALIGYLIYRVNAIQLPDLSAMGSNIISSVEKSYMQFTTTSTTNTERIIDANKNSLDPSGELQRKTAASPYGTSILPNWQYERNVQVGRPTNIENIWGDINRLHTATVPINRQMLGNIQMSNRSYFDGLHEIASGGGIGGSKRMFTPVNPGRFQSPAGYSNESSVSTYYGKTPPGQTLHIFGNPNDKVILIK